jgi:hypothetical protein
MRTNCVIGSGIPARRQKPLSMPQGRAIGTAQAKSDSISAHTLLSGSQPGPTLQIHPTEVMPATSETISRRGSGTSSSMIYESHT